MEETNNNKDLNDKNNNSIISKITGTKAAIIIITLSLVIGIILGTINPVILNDTNTAKNSESKKSSPTPCSGYTSGGVQIPTKPIIYLYPENTIELKVTLGNPEKITHSYPKYVDGWNVIANPNGTLIDKDTGKELYSLYWEGIDNNSYSYDDGFCVKGEDTTKFLEEKLSILGLSEREAEEFIIYWLPILENNKYNYIRFATMDEINEIMPLNFSVKPDSIIRVLMQYKPLENEINVKNQKLITPERKGFVAVEWGGTELK